MVIAAALLVAFMVVRVAMVEAFAAKQPEVAAAVWPGHPSVLLETGLAEVGEAAAAGEPVDGPLVGRLISASAKAPLAPEPFLVRGVQAQVSGNRELALRSYLAARERSPRAVAPRYFLAEQYLQAGRIGPGLAEISSLARLVPRSLPSIAPYLAAYARVPSAAAQVKQVLKTHPQLETALLNELAADAANANLILYLWSGQGGEEARVWQARLLSQLAESGRFREARRAWARFGRLSAEEDRLFDPDFVARALPPFGWTLTSGPSGIVEPERGGRLHVIYYGRDDLALASQLVTLPSGAYRLSMRVDAAAPAAGSLVWTIQCLPSSDPIFSLPVRGTGMLTASFRVTDRDCAAQRLELRGDAPELPQQAEIRISRLQLQREGGR